MTGGRFFAITGVIIVVVLAIVGLQSVFVVDPTKYALVLRFGQPVDTALQPGLYFKVPFVDNVVYIEKRLISFSRTPQSTLQEENEIVAGDQRRINVLAFGRYRITDPLRFYESVGTVAVANSRLLAILDAAVRTVLGDASFQEIVRDDRTDLMSEITNRVAQGATNLGVEVVDVRIQRLDLPQDNADRIYVRMQTERQQEAALIRAQGDEAARRIRAAADREVTVTIANANRDAEVLRGAGDAEANLIYARAYGQDEEFFRFYRSLQAYNVSLTPGTTTMMLSPTSDFFRYFNLIGTVDVPPTPLDPALLPEVPAIPEVPALPDPVIVPAPAIDGAVPAGP